MPHTIAYRKATVLMLGLALCVLLPENAHAANSPMGSVLCNIIGIIYGNLGRALATLAIIFLGIGALLAKVSWGLALTVCGGIGVIFSAPWIIHNFLFAIN